MQGSYDPVWSAEAEGRFLGSVLFSRRRSIVLTIARVFVAVAVLSWMVQPLVPLVQAAQAALQRTAGQ
jgi:hypothetical protein